MAARKIKARLGSVRLVLSEAAEFTRAYHSSLQGKVVEDMVKDCQLTAEEKADIASVVSSVGFMAKDEELLLASLSGVSSSKMARRKPQIFNLSYSILLVTNGEPSVHARTTWTMPSTFVPM
jgi:hypothetical protein